MPYSAVERPSVALGTLKAVLVRAGVSTHLVYGSLRFAEAIGLSAYESINSSAILDRAGEWTFAAAAFGEASLPQPAEYLEKLTGGLENAAAFCAQLLEIRRMAAVFVDELAREIVARRPRIVGCSSLFQQQCASLALLRRVRELDPGIVTMLGGGNCEGEMGWVAHQSFEWVDFVVSGEADELLPPLCQAILESGRDLPASRLGPGVFGPAHRSGLSASGGATAPTGEALFARVERMDQLPPPDYDDYFAELARTSFRAHVHPGIPIETARGCWWGQLHHCTFCGISDSGMRFRAKTAAQIAGELDELFGRYAIDRFVTADNIIEPSYFDTLMPALERSRRGYALFYQTKANLKRHQVELLARAGVRWIQPGIESLDDRVLQLLVKGASASINVQLLKWARNAGVWVIWNLLFGAPGEEDSWYAELAGWLPLIFHLQPPAAAQLTAIRYNRFSPYFQEPERFGLDLVPGWAYQYTYPHDAERRSRQAYYFNDRRDAAHSADLRQRPGVRRLNERIGEWSALFAEAGAGPMQTMRADAPRLLASAAAGGGLIIEDTRPCAVQRTHRLEGLEAEVYRACDASSTVAGVVRSLAQAQAQAEAGADERRVLGVLRELKQRKLTLEFGERVLSLANDAPAQPYRSPLDFPAGLLFRRPAARAASPWEQPLASLFTGSPQTSLSGVTHHDRNE